MADPAQTNDIMTGAVPVEYTGGDKTKPYIPVGNQGSNGAGIGSSESSYTSNSFNNVPIELTAATSAQDVVPASGTKSFYITDISISVDAAMSVKMQDNTGTPVQIIARKFLPANAVWSKSYKTPKKVPAGKKLQAVCSVSSGNVSIDVDGFYL